MVKVQQLKLNEDKSGRQKKKIPISQMKMISCSWLLSLKEEILDDRFCEMARMTQTRTLQPGRDNGWGTWEKFE